MKKIDRMGVLVLMSHLIITLAIIIIYAITLFHGDQDETLKTVLTVIVGYWFGSMGGQAIRTTQNKVDLKKDDNKKGA